MTTLDAGEQDRTVQSLPVTQTHAWMRAAWAVLVTGVIAAGALLVTFIVALVGAFWGGLSAEKVALAAYVTLTLAFAIAARRLDRDWREVLGLKTFTVGRGFAAFTALVLLNIIVGEVLESIFPELEKLFEFPENPEWIAFISMIVLGAPIAEEILFRGYLHHRLRAHLSAFTTIAVSSVLFAIAHFDGDFLYPLLTFPGGMILGYARERLGSVAPCIAFHMLFNAVAVATEFFGV